MHMASKTVSLREAAIALLCSASADVKPPTINCWAGYILGPPTVRWAAGAAWKLARCASCAGCLDRQFFSLLVRQLHAPGAGAYGPPRPSVDARSPLISALAPDIAAVGATNARRQLKRRQRRGTEKPPPKQARFRFPQGYTAPQAPHGPAEGLGWPSSQASSAPQPPPLLRAPAAGAAGAATCPLSMCCMCHLCAGPSVTELPGWRVGILFLLFLVITVTWDRGIA